MFQYGYLLERRCFLRWDIYVRMLTIKQTKYGITDYFVLDEVFVLSSNASTNSVAYFLISSLTTYHPYSNKNLQTESHIQIFVLCKKAT